MVYFGPSKVWVTKQPRTSRLGQTIIYGYPSFGTFHQQRSRMNGGSSKGLMTSRTQPQMLSTGTQSNFIKADPVKLRVQAPVDYIVLLVFSSGDNTFSIISKPHAAPPPPPPRTSPLKFLDVSRTFGVNIAASGAMDEVSWQQTSRDSRRGEGPFPSVLQYAPCLLRKIENGACMVFLAIRKPRCTLYKVHASCSRKYEPHQTPTFFPTFSPLRFHLRVPSGYVLFYSFGAYPHFARRSMSFTIAIVEQFLLQIVAIDAEIA